ncbi:MAG: heavy metal-associated domain-containing protein [bacterium]
MTITTYTVQGMTCEHCVRSVTEEVARIPGVDGVRVDLAGGRVTVTAAQEPPVDALRAAVGEAGYQLVEA